MTNIELISSDMQNFALAASKRLSTKIIGILVVFFLFAITAIGLTLVVSWQLEGGAAAINDAGSQRMRSYQIGQMLALGAQHPAYVEALSLELQAALAKFEVVQGELETGNPDRPLSPPRGKEAEQRVKKLTEQWRQRIRPLVVQYLEPKYLSKRQVLALEYEHRVNQFVSGINDYVFLLERNYAYNTNLLRSLQVVLAVLAFVGTLILIRFFFVLVIRPVDHLHQGIVRMAEGDLAARLPIETEDEFGTLARGFNDMAVNLQTVYATLEDRVEAKTRSLAEKNRELETLYAITAFLSEPSNALDMCNGFMERIKAAIGADAASVRLHSTDKTELLLLTHSGLSDEFVAAESVINCGECVCGEALTRAVPIAVDTRQPPPGMSLRNCVREGFHTVTAIAVTHNRTNLGAFNLYFTQRREFSDQDMLLLETLGQHLGIALETLRLQSREKELAISEERNLLAQELHDSIAQGLAYLNIQAQLLEQALDKNDIQDARKTTLSMRAGIQESYDDVRELLVHFRTRMDQSDLDTAILIALERFEQQTGIKTEFDRSGYAIALSPEDNIQVLHIVQEALSNIRKHADATMASVTIERNRNSLTVIIADDGKGFQMQGKGESCDTRHVGLLIMKERAERVGATCTIQSSPGSGTKVSLVLSKQS